MVNTLRKSMNDRCPTMYFCGDFLNDFFRYAYNLNVLIHLSIRYNFASFPLGMGIKFLYSLLRSPRSCA